MKIPDDHELLRRAKAAYFRSGGGTSPDEFSGVISAGKGKRAKLYVALIAGDVVLAVYRVRVDGILKRLKRWPRELEV